jgi:CSLREA domain-containing protein
MPVSANTIIVDITYDEDEANEDCSLREAIYAAWYGTTYNGCESGSPGADEIILSTETYTVDNQLPNITDVVIISGVSSSETIIQASSCNPTQETCTNDHELFWVPWTGTLTLSNLTVRNGQNIGDLNGGVIYNEGSVQIDHSVFSANRGTKGGVILNLGGTIFISNSTFASNMAQNTGGYYYGGVIFNSTTGTVNIETSTFTGNSALNGGAIHNYGVLDIVNSTFSGNIATNKGGGIINDGKLTSINCTFSENSATNGGAGIYNNSEGTLNLTNTLIGNSTIGADCVTETPIGTNLNNLIEDKSCSAKYDGDPSIGPLANNGGPTQTHALQSSSLAIDNGHSVRYPTTDQRGVTRPQGEGYDIGAYERESFTYTYLPLIMK